MNVLAISNGRNWFIGSLLVLGTLAAVAQQPPVQSGPLVREGVTTKISDHVYVIPDNSVPGVPNVGIIVGKRSTLIIDTGLGKQNGATVLREALKLSGKTALYLVTTHVHPEHDLGAQAFPATTKMIRSKDQEAEIAEFGQQTADAFRKRSPVMQQLLEGAEFRQADITFDKEYLLDLGGVSVRIIAMGPNHTPGDTAIFVAGERILFAGDIAMKGLPAFASPKASLAQWLTSLDRLEALKPKTIVPSHGPMGDVNFITDYRRYLTLVRTRTAALKAEGKTVEQATEILSAELKSQYPETGRLAGAIRIAYAEAENAKTTGLDVNNPTGTRGLIMIDKQGVLVRFFDPTTLNELSQLTIEGTPHELAISPDHQTAYVPDYGTGVYGRNPNPGHSIAMIDLASHKLIGAIDISPYVAPHGLQVDASGTLYATCDLSRKLLVIDPKTRSITAAIDTEGTGHWSAVLPDGSKAYVANKNDRLFVSVIDLKARKMIGQVPMPKGTQGITVSPDGKHVLAIDLVDPRIAVIDTATDKVVDEIVVQDNTKGLWRTRYSPDGTKILVVNVAEKTVSILRTADLHGKQLLLQTGSQPFGIAFTADSNTALVSNHGDGTITVVDLKSNVVAKTFKAGTGIETLSYY
jgi:YVTN family beta-propeller protein